MLKGMFSCRKEHWKINIFLLHLVKKLSHLCNSMCLDKKKPMKKSIPKRSKRLNIQGSKEFLRYIKVSFYRKFIKLLNFLLRQSKEASDLQFPNRFWVQHCHCQPSFFEKLTVFSLFILDHYLSILKVSWQLIWFK